MLELTNKAHEQLIHNRITNYKIVTFLDNDNAQYDDDDDLECVFPDSDDEDDINNIQPLELKLILEPILKLTPASDSHINIQPSNIYHHELIPKKYAVKFNFAVDNNCNFLQTSDIQYLQQPTIQEIESSAYDQLSDDKSATYQIKSIKDNAGVEFNDNDDVEDAFDDLDDETAVLILQIILITVTAKASYLEPVESQKLMSEPVNNNENIALFRQLLIDWELDQFADKFKEQGWDEPIGWDELINDCDYLRSEIGFGKGHINKFNRKCKEWLQINVEPQAKLSDTHSNDAQKYTPSAIETTYARLSIMGFSHELCMEAASKFPNSVASASEWILQVQTQDDTNKCDNTSNSGIRPTMNPLRRIPIVNIINEPDCKLNIDDNKSNTEVTQQNIVDKSEISEININKSDNHMDKTESKTVFVNDIHSQLINMGYPYDTAMDAAFRFGNKINDAIMWIKEQETLNNEELNNNNTYVRPIVNRRVMRIVDDSDIVVNEQKTSRQIVDDCKSVESCPSLNKIIAILKLYQDIDKSKHLVSSISEHQDFEGLLNHYHHVLKTHNEFDTVNKLLVQQNDLTCDVKTCDIFIRNSNKKQEITMHKCNDANLSLYMNTLDTIHCYFMHHDQQIHGNGKTYNKFLTKIEIELVSKVEAQVNAGFDNDEKYVQDLQYSFGERFNYWNNKSKPKYGSIKHEIMDNNVHTISMNAYDELYKKSVIFLANSNKLKALKCIKRNPYRISINSCMDVKHIMVLILYTDFDTLSHYFSSTFRKIRKNETHEQIKKRNTEFWRWSKALIESVNCFGQKIDSSNIDIFYHGISMIYFDSFIATFNSPTSTTTKLALATMFADKHGLVLELKMNKRKWSRSLMYFNCTFVSCFSHEDERLFIQPEDQRSCLEFASIRNILTNENYKQYIDALTIFQKIITNDYYVNVPSESMRLIACMINNDNKCPTYILKCFQKWANNRKQLRLNLETLPNKLSKYICHSIMDNLVCMDKINILFQNVEKISCRQIGPISINYLKLLFVMLSTVNKLQHTKLRKIYLLNITNANTINLKEFRNDNWNWQITEYDGDDLVVYRTDIIENINTNYKIATQLNNKYSNKEWLRYDRYLSWRKGEIICMCSKVEREGWTSKEEKILLLSNYEKLYLIDENKQIIEEEWIRRMIKKVEIVGYHKRFILHLVNNKIQFKCINTDPKIWQTLISEMSTFQV